VVNLWLVTNGWRGNGLEGVIVEAESEAQAIDAAAEEFLRSDAEEAAGMRSMPDWWVNHQAQRAEQFAARRDLQASRIALPYRGEFS
jgi:hypothetical protein